MPRGLSNSGEAQVGKSKEFLTEEQRDRLTRWWVANRKGATLPKWDILSTGTVDGERGLILIEAKAHENELKVDDRSGSMDPSNRERIAEAIREANDGLNLFMPGWALSRDSHYQLSNRFAWSWKVADLGTPVILVYLGFLNAEEMADQGPQFSSARDWAEVVRSYASGVVPDEAWTRGLETRGAPMRALIRAIDLQWETHSYGESRKE